MTHEKRPAALTNNTILHFCRGVKTEYGGFGVTSLGGIDAVIDDDIDIVLVDYGRRERRNVSKQNTDRARPSVQMCPSDMTDENLQVNKIVPQVNEDECMRRNPLPWVAFISVTLALKRGQIIMEPKKIIANSL